MTGLFDPFLIYVVSVNVALLGLALSLIVITVLLRLGNMVRARHWSDRERCWTPMIMETANGDRTAEWVTKEVLPRDAFFFLDVLTRHAARIRGEEGDRLAMLAKPFLPAVAATWNRGRAETRARRIKYLGLFGLEAHRNTVLRATGDSSPWVVLVAFRALCQPHHEDIADLVVVAVQRLDFLHPSYMAELLVRLGPSGIPMLRNYFNDGLSSLSVRVIAGEALAALNDAESAASAYRLLKSDVPQPIVIASLKILERVGRADHVEEIRKRCRHEDPVIRVHAFRALVRLGGATDLMLFRHGFIDDFRWAALQAARGLVRLGDLQGLVAMANSDQHYADLAREVMQPATS